MIGQAINNAYLNILSPEALF